jgi:glycosyltransferase involved in cell wall biosynthesis
VKVVYVSYDGALDPLGASQVLPYLARLAGRGVAFTLISFEKADRWADRTARERLRRELAAAGIDWKPIRYHRRPRALATFLDLLLGIAATRKATRRAGEIVHARGDVAATMARLANGKGAAKLLYDVRGFFGDERVESGSWPEGGAIDRTVRRAEAANLARADAIVVLTTTALDDLRRLRPNLPPHAVIPTCVDLEAFARAAPGAVFEYAAIYFGSFGTRYMPEDTVALGRSLGAELGGRILFLTPHGDEAFRAGATPDWAEVKSAAPDLVPQWLRRGRAAFFLYRPGRHVRATFPTRLAEALATGLPVVTNHGIGDLDALIEGKRVGVMLRAFSDDAFRDGARRLKTLLEDPETAVRCRSLAESDLGVELGAERYLQLYRAMTARR